MKIKILALLSVLTIALCGCNTDISKETPIEEQTQESEKMNLNEYTEDNTHSYIGGVFNYTDPDTGVCYLIYKDVYSHGSMGGITVRYNPDGTIMVKEVD